ncbi:DUF4349 domain-containing protein [Alicyclobacillus sp. ALC3]|uniref:DUF4349 domain-containing protein n=1 Tax=Alicyclobacillus sp. ALC3 TaxID=2796143 RepID=UPI0023798A04|nr:DUF4349 domain-containing protein [Alicyclobacillus sp. ALC3]WDL98647.1 DUF4349 domain-containing protein [Alicyclobacillus sp. ALC3]
MSVNSSSRRHRLLAQLAFARRRVWWAVGAGVVLLVIASLAVTAPGRHGSGGQMSGRTSTASSGVTASSPAVGYGAGSAEQAGVANSGPTHGATVAASVGQTRSIGSSSGQHLVIETANLDMTVTQLPKATSDITSLAEASGGFVHSMNQLTDGQGQNSATLTIRVPENKFQTALKNIKSLGKVDTFSQSGQDVTSEHNNLQLQVTELQSEAKAYTRLFDKATKMSDMLQIQQSLTETNNQISNLNSQLHQLNHTIQYTTINITLQPSVVPIHQGSEPFWAPIVQSLHFMDRVGVGLSKVIGWLLPWAALGGLVYGGVLVWRRGASRKA